MNIYLMNATSLGRLSALLLCKSLPIKGIISLRDKTSTNEYFDYSGFAQEMKIDNIQVQDYSLRNGEDRKLLSELDIDVLIVVSWQRLLPAWLLKQCRIGAVGMHGSVKGISAGRGRSPQNWALIFGADSFTISVFWIDAEIDAGDILASKTFSYNVTDDISASYVKTQLAMVEMLKDAYETGSLMNRIGVKQSGEVGYLPQRTAEDGMIDWHRSAFEIYNFVRALSLPYPCAYTKIADKCVKIIRANYIESTLLEKIGYEPGEIIGDLQNEELLVKCGQGALQIMEYDCEAGVEIKSGLVFQSADFSEQMYKIIKRHIDKTGLEVSDWLKDIMSK